MIYHVMCYSAQFQEKFIGTNVRTLKNIFEYLDRFFNATIHKVVVVETNQVITRIQPGMQLELGL